MYKKLIMLYLLYRIGFFILRVAPYKTAYGIVSLSAKIKYFISKRDRDIVKANLKRVLPQAEKKEISLLAKEVFVNFGKYLVDFFSLIKDEKGYLEKSVEISGLENLDEALSLGKGCIIVTGHFGNWELSGCAVAYCGYKVNAVVLLHSDPKINSIFIDERRKKGINVINIGQAKTECQKALDRGEIIAILGDRPFGDHGIEVDFFNKKAIVPRGPAIFSLRKGAPIVIVFSFKEDTTKNIYRLILDKPFLINTEQPFEKNIKDITQRFISSFEYYIKRYPSQWYMFNEVWKEY